MKKYSNKTVIESLGLPMLTCFDDLVKELSLSRKRMPKEDIKLFLLKKEMVIKGKLMHLLYR